MKILFINNDGGGFANHVDVADGTAIDSFVEDHLDGRRAEDYLIRVNREPVSRGYVLQDGDRVSITPTKIEGASVA